MTIRSITAISKANLNVGVVLALRQCMIAKPAPDLPPEVVQACRLNCDSIQVLKKDYAEIK